MIDLEEAKRKKPTPPAPDPDSFSPDAARDFIIGTPGGHERLQELKKAFGVSKRTDDGEFWIPYASKGQYSDFSATANYEYFERTYPWLNKSGARIGLDADDLPENVIDLPELLAGIPDDQWEQFLQEIKYVRDEGGCLDDNRESELRNEAEEEWWKPPFGGYNDYLDALKLKFRSGRISHILDYLTPWELLQVAGNAGYYIEDQGEGSVYMDTDRAADNTDWEDIEQVIQQRYDWEQQREAEPGEPPRPPRKNVADLEKEWDDRKWEAWQGEIGKRFLAALHKTARNNDDLGALAKYSESDLFEVFNWVMDAERKDGPLWWTTPRTITKRWDYNTRQDVEEPVEPTIHLTSYREHVPGRNRWKPEDTVQEAAEEAAELAWEYIRRGRKSYPKEHPEFKFEAVQPKDFILNQPVPSTQGDWLNAECPGCHRLVTYPRTWGDSVEVISLACPHCKHDIPLKDFDVTGQHDYVKEAVEPRDFILSGPEHAEDPDKKMVYAHCPKCKRQWGMRLRHKQWGTNLVCPQPCGASIPAALFEAVDPKDFILNQPPRYAPMGQQMRLDCPSCGRSRLVMKNWPDGLEDQGWGSKCECGTFLRYRNAVADPALESMDAKDFILGQPEGPLNRQYWQQQFGDKDDDYWGIVEDPEQETYVFQRTGTSHAYSVGYAEEIRHRLGADRVAIFGFTGDDNPGSLIGRLLGGADFAVVDGRYVIDPSLNLMPEDLTRVTQGRVAFDLQDPADADILAQLYGDRSKWETSASPKQAAQVREGLDPKKFIMDQPEFALRVRGLRNTRHLPVAPAPWEMVNNLESRGWRSVGLAEPTKDYPSWEIYFMRSTRQEIARQRGEDIDGNAFKDVVHQVMYHFDGYLGIDMRTDDKDYDYVVKITPLTPTAESVDPKDYILDMPDEPVTRVESAEGAKPEFVEFQVWGRRRKPRVYNLHFIAQQGENAARGIWFVYKFDMRPRRGVETLAQFPTKDEAVREAERLAWAAARERVPAMEAVYRGSLDPDKFDPNDVRDWLLTGGPDVGQVLHDSPTLYVIIPQDKHTYEKYLAPKGKSWAEIKQSGDIIIAVPEPDAPNPGNGRAVGLREYYQYGLEVFEPRMDFDELFQEPYADELRPVLVKHYQKKARQAKRDGDDDEYERSVVSLAQVGGHEALRGHYRHMKPGTLPSFDWKYGIVLAKRGRLAAAARWLREPREKITRTGLYACFDDWSNMTNLFAEDRHNDYRRAAKKLFDGDAYDWFDHVYENKPDWDDICHNLPEAGWAEVRKLLNWTVIRNDPDESWAGLEVRSDGTSILSPHVVAALDNSQIQELFESVEEYDSDGHLEEIADGLVRGWQDAERGAYEDAYYKGYTESIESALGTKPVWIKVGGKDKLSWLIPWDTISKWLADYYEGNNEHFSGDFEDLLISHADRAQPSEDYYPDGKDIAKRFATEDFWSYGLDSVKEADPPEPVVDPNQPELFEPETTLPPEPQKPVAKPPPAPGLGESLLMEGYKYACAMIELPPKHADFLLGWGRTNIPDNVLYALPEGDGNGRELEPHVTVKYGITLNEVPHELHQIVQQTPAFPVYMGAISLFQQEGYDVVKLTVESPWLRQLNARITATLPCEGDKHPNYNPHTTLAYVKKGSCDQLVGQDPFAAEGSPGAEFVAYGMVFKGASELENDPARVKEHLLFNKKKKPEPPLGDLQAEAQPPSKRERVRAAAVRHKALGTVTPGATHSEAMERMVDWMRTNGHWNLTWSQLEALPDKQRNRYWNQVEFGFWTSNNRFVDKEEASRISGIQDIHGEDIREAVDPKEFISTVPEPRYFYAKLAFSELGTGLPDLWLAHWGKMSVEHPDEAFPVKSNVPGFDYLESLKQWIVRQYGEPMLKLLRIEPVYESIPAGVGPYETLPFPANPGDLIRFLRSSQKRRPKTLL